MSYDTHKARKQSADKTTTSTSKPTIPVDRGNTGDEAVSLGVGAVPAGGAAPVTTAVASEHDLLTSLEARLTDEMCHLASALISFGTSTQAIGEELPASSDFGKIVTLFLSSCGFEFANALLQSGDKPLLIDNGAKQLAELELSVIDAFREVTLDGRRFLAVALTDKSPDKPL